MKKLVAYLDTGSQNNCRKKMLSAFFIYSMVSTTKRIHFKIRSAKVNES